MNKGLFSFRLKIEDREIDITGTQEFIDQLKSDIPEWINLLTGETTPSLKPENSSTEVTNEPFYPQTIEEIFESDFDVWKRSISKTTDESVSFMIAGYYIQKKELNDYFQTKAVYNLLYENGILLEDIKQCVDHNLSVKNIVKVGQKNKKTKYRISDQVLDLMHEILVDSQFYQT